MFRTLFITLTVAIGSPGWAADFTARHDLTAAEYSSWLEELKLKDHSPTHVSVHIMDGKPVFAGIAVPTGKTAWVARHDLDGAEYQRLFNEQTRDGKRVACVCNYHDGKVERFATVFIKEGGFVGATHSATGERLKVASDNATREGWAPFLVNGCSTPDGPRFAIVFSGTGEWAANYGIDDANYRKVIDGFRRDGFVPTWASGFDDASSPRFNLIGRRDPGLEWVARHDMPSADFQKERDRLDREGYTLKQLSGYAAGGKSRYVAVWVREIPLPVTGEEVPELAAFDQAMVTFMKERGIRAGTLAVMRADRLIFSRGYGFATADGKKRIDPDAPLRLASVVKPFTVAAIRRLIDQGKLRENTRVFELLRVDPPEGSKPDPRLNDITINHLLNHRGGWNADKAAIGDPMFQPKQIADTLRIGSPPKANDIIRYMVGQPLEFAPGSESKYSNFGYCVLGRVIEKVSGKSYESYLRQEILAPLKITSIDLGRTLPYVRHPREPYYSDPGAGLNVMTGKGFVPSPDGSFHLESMDSHGGLIGSAPDVARFVYAYQADGRPGKVGSWMFFGGLPGTSTMVYRRPDGLVMVALFNQSSGPPGKPYNIRETLDQVANGIKKWP